MNWREELAGYFHFTRRDRLAVLVLTGLVIGVLLLPSFLPSQRSREDLSPDTAWIAALRALENTGSGNQANSTAGQTAQEDGSSYLYDRSLPPNRVPSPNTLFAFDPNTLEPEGWKKLGLRDKTIATIRNYLAKGGRFYKPTDLAKIYGLSKTDFDRLAPYIRIVGREIETPAGKTGPGTGFLPRRERYAVIDINRADTGDFIALPGIGSKLAARIISFREKLGGFYSVEQLGETYGLPDSTFQQVKKYLKLENAETRKIRINTAGLDELKAHPYIRHSLAATILAYRDEHGPFARLEDIKKVMAVTEEIYRKIAPYLSL